MDREEAALRLMSVAEVANTIGLSESAVYRAIAVGELRASKLRGRLRVRLTDLERWIEAGRVDPVTPRHTSHSSGHPRVAARGGGLRELLRQET